MGCRVVCIARVTAAGGEAIGHAVSERLGFRYVDDEVITVAAETAGIDPAALENVEHEQGLFARLLEAIVTTPRAPEGLIARRPSNSYYDEAGPPPAPLARDDLRELIQGAIREIARRGEAVIVAHAASFALARQPDVLRVWVTASPEVRVERLWIPNKLVSEDQYAEGDCKLGLGATAVPGTLLRHRRGAPDALRPGPEHGPALHRSGHRSGHCRRDRLKQRLRRRPASAIR